MLLGPFAYWRDQARQIAVLKNKKGGETRGTEHVRVLAWSVT